MKNLFIAGMAVAFVLVIFAIQITSGQEDKRAGVCKSKGGLWLLQEGICIQAAPIKVDP